MIQHVCFVLWTISGVVFADSGLLKIHDRIPTKDSQPLDSIEARFRTLEGQQTALQQENYQFNNQLRRTDFTLNRKVDQLQSEQKALKQMNTDLTERAHHLKEFAETSVSFFAHPSSDATYNAGQFLQFGYVITNIGHAFNPVTGIFLAPVTGLYVFHVTVMSADNGRPNKSALYVFLLVDDEWHAAIYSGLDPVHYVQGSGQVVVKLTKDQIVRVQNAYDNTKYYGDASSFGGALLHADIA